MVSPQVSKVGSAQSERENEREGDRLVKRAGSEYCAIAHGGREGGREGVTRQGVHHAHTCTGLEARGMIVPRTLHHLPVPVEVQTQRLTHIIAHVQQQRDVHRALQQLSSGLHQQQLDVLRALLVRRDGGVPRHDEVAHDKVDCTRCNSQTWVRQQAAAATGRRHAWLVQVREREQRHTAAQQSPRRRRAHAPISRDTSTGTIH
jgi:hypothetical protein